MRTSNLQVALLASLKPGEEATRKHLEMAKAVLSRPNVVAASSSCLPDLARSVLWRLNGTKAPDEAIKSFISDVTVNAGSHDVELDLSALLEVKAANRLDAELHEWVVRKFCAPGTPTKSQAETILDHFAPKHNAGNRGATDWQLYGAMMPNTNAFADPTEPGIRLRVSSLQVQVPYE